VAALSVVSSDIVVDIKGEIVALCYCLGMVAPGKDTNKRLSVYFLFLSANKSITPPHYSLPGNIKLHNYLLLALLILIQLYSELQSLHIHLDPLPVFY